RRTPPTGDRSGAAIAPRSCGLLPRALEPPTAAAIRPSFRVVGKSRPPTRQPPVPPKDGLSISAFAAPPVASAHHAADQVAVNHGLGVVDLLHDGVAHVGRTHGDGCLRIPRTRTRA